MRCTPAFVCRVQVASPWAQLGSSQCPAVYTGVRLWGPVRSVSSIPHRLLWSVSSIPHRPLWHAWSPLAHAFCLSFPYPTRTGMPKARPHRWFGALIMGVLMRSNVPRRVHGTSYSKSRLPATQPCRRFSISPFAPSNTCLISKRPPSFCYICIFLLIPLPLLLLLLLQSVPLFFLIQGVVLCDGEVQTIQLLQHRTKDEMCSGMKSLFLSTESRGRQVWWAPSHIQCIICIQITEISARLFSIIDCRQSTNMNVCSRALAFTPGNRISREERKKTTSKSISR